MEHVSVYLHEILQFFRDGFRDGFSHVNGALGLIIAVFAAYQLSDWKRIWAVALGATLAHLVAVIMIPCSPTSAASSFRPTCSSFPIGRRRLRYSWAIWS